MKTIDELHAEAAARQGENYGRPDSEWEDSPLGKGEPRTIALGEFGQGIMIRCHDGMVQVYGWYDYGSEIGDWQEGESGRQPFEIPLHEFMEKLGIEATWMGPMHERRNA